MVSRVRVVIHREVIATVVTGVMTRRHVQDIAESTVRIARASPQAPVRTGRLTSALYVTGVGSNASGAFARVQVNQRIAPHARFVLRGTGAYRTGPMYGTGHLGPWIVSTRPTDRRGRTPAWMRLSYDPLSGRGGFTQPGRGPVFAARVSGQRPRASWLQNALSAAMVQHGH